MKYLITGGAGFIGSHLTDVLLDRGDVVTVLDDLSTGDRANIVHHTGNPAFNFQEGSILEETLVRDLVGDADAVVHLAAAVGVRLILNRPLESLVTNIRGTEVVIEACAAAGRKIMVASTSEIYGKNGQGPLREDSDCILGSPYRARWSYSAAKAVDEIIAHTYGRQRGMPSIVVRLFNCVGSRQTGAYGMVVPRLVLQALRAEDLTVFGDGKQRRCFCHVADTVECLVRLLEHPNAIGDVFNVGSGEEMTINDLAALIIELTGSKSSIVHIPYDQAYGEAFEDVRRRVPDISKVNALTGWRPRRSLREIVAEVIAHESAKLAETER